MQNNLSPSATIVTVDNSMHQQNIPLQLYGSNVKYQIVQNNGIQQVAYVTQPQIFPFITNAQKTTLPNTHIQVFYLLIK